MQALAIDAFGEPATVRDLPMVEPEEGQLRLRVAVAGLNPFDVSVVQGNLAGQDGAPIPTDPRDGRGGNGGRARRRGGRLCDR